MADCGAQEFSRGGVIAEAQVTNTTMTDSRVSSSDLQSCNLKTLASVDEASARAIASAISALPEGALAELASAISGQIAANFLKPGAAPAMAADDDLPTTVAGGRDALLGRPAAWLKYQDYVIPGYAGKD